MGKKNSILKKGKGRKIKKEKRKTHKTQNH